MRKEFIFFTTILANKQKKIRKIKKERAKIEI